VDEDPADLLADGWLCCGHIDNGMMPDMRRHLVGVGVGVGAAVVGGLWCQATFAAAPFELANHPRIDPAKFRVTTFASGLAYPTGMLKQSDGSLLVAINDPTGGRYYASTGKLLRLTDENHDGVADDAGTYLNTSLPGAIVQMRRAGDLLIVNSALASGGSINILRAGPTPTSPFAAAQMHDTYALAVRPTATSNMYDVYFNVGSRNNATNDATTIAASGLINANLNPESIYRFTLTDSGGSSVTATNVQQIARGLRNAAGIAFHPTSGDMYFQENGIDGGSESADPVSADEINVIPAGQLGGPAIPNFGFAGDYIQYRTGTRVGSGGVQPIATFQPFGPSQIEAEGAAEIAFAPPNFPDELNDGMFVGFHGRFSTAGVANEENPLLYLDLATNEYFEFIPNSVPTIGHLDNILATDDALFVSDITSAGNIFTTTAAGAIYQIIAIPDPATAALVPMTIVLSLGGRRRRAASVRSRDHDLHGRHW
jgi:glucose/arabinose dehydrogenase